MRILSYDKISGTLIVDFPCDLVNDRVHEFYDIPAHIFASLEAASNPSGYFNENIWGNKFEKKVYWKDIASLLEYFEEYMFFHPPVMANAKSADGDTPLYVVAQWGDFSDLSLLIEIGVDVNNRGDMGCTPLFTAISAGHARCTKILLESGVNVNDTNEFCTSSLSLAMTEGNESIGEKVAKFV
jgi:ankyrin repeat protein